MAVEIQASPQVCKGNSGILNLQRKIKRLAGEEAGWVCVCVTVVLPKSPQGQWEVGSEVRQCLKADSKCLWT